MNEPKILILISLACLTFAEWSGVIDNIKFYIWLVTSRSYNSRLKPFDCAKCLTFWVSLAIFLYLEYRWWAILYAFANSGITVLINKIYERISKG